MELLCIFIVVRLGSISIASGASSRTNNTNLAKKFCEQGSDGWYYGMCDWDGGRLSVDITSVD